MYRLRKNRSLIFDRTVSLNIKCLSENIIKKLGILMFGLILAADTFMGDRLNYADRVDFGISNIGLLVLGGVIFFYFFSGKQEKRNLRIIDLGTLVAVLFIIQQYIIRHTYFLTGWDAGTVNSIANTIVFGGEWDGFWTFYIQKYPNNVLLVCIFVVLKHIAAFLHCNPDYFLVWINVIAIDFSVVLTGMALRNIIEDEVLVRCGLVLIVLLVGLSPWMLIPYSDTFSLPFPILTFCMYLRYKETPGRSIAGICLVPVVGMLIKPQCIIPLIAIVLAELMKNNERIRVAAVVEKTIIFILCIGMAVVISAVAHNICGVQKDKDAQVSYTHYLMMGLNKNSNGSFSFEDNDITDSVYGYKEKQAENWRVIKTRLRDMGGIPGLCDHEVRKLLVNFNDGTFAFGKEGSFYKEVPDRRGEVGSQWMCSVYWDTGKYYHILAGVLQSGWLIVLSLCLAGLILDKNALSECQMMLLLSILGNMAFSILFEARARYQMIFVPMYILFAVSVISGVDSIKFFKRKQRGKEMGGG